MIKCLLSGACALLLLSGCTKKLSPSEEYERDWTKGFHAFRDKNLSDNEFSSLMADNQGFQDGWQDAFTAHLKLYKNGFDDAVNGKLPTYPEDHNNYMKGYAKGLEK